MKLCLFVLLIGADPMLTVAQTATTAFQLNQCGFYPKSHKLAVLTEEATETQFYIAQAGSKKIVFTGTLSEQQQSAYSSTKTRLADFSAYTKPGKYIVISGKHQSQTFEIKDGVYQSVANAVLKAYYFQRASMPLESAYAGKWQRSGFHPDDLVYIHPSAASPQRPTGSTIASPGGWYDAGDYNKYIVNSGITMGTLFSAYEDFPAYFQGLKTNIPESHDAVPDMLHETICNLRWMLTMQDLDGGVYHKCTNASFDGMVMPGVTKEKRWVVQKGTAASLEFAAVTAQAARILNKFGKQFPGLADSCLQASRKAWNWALLHPNILYKQEELNQQFQPAITTGSYGDGRLEDEWLWAASELFLTTREAAFYQTVSKHLPTPFSLPSWSNVGMMGIYSFLRSAPSLPANISADLAQMKTRFLAMADAYLDKAKTNAFGTVMGQSAKDFVWGSNSVAANQGMLLVKAYLLTKNKKYLDHALGNADYLLGRNATGYCFVTGQGSLSPMHPHHRQSVADGIAEPVPGLMVGGPNPGRQDGCAYPFTETETAYVDVDCSYASNEIAINWNAPAVYLFHALEALKQQAGWVGK